jgi:hypothetical protein
VGTTQAGGSDPIYEQLTHVGAHQDRAWLLTARVGSGEPAAGPRRLRDSGLLTAALALARLAAKYAPARHSSSRAGKDRTA